MISASCNCGAVSFRLNTAPDYLYTCHCSICRRFTGAGSFPIILVDPCHFQWIKGQDQITQWQHPDSDWQARFCKTCGSAVPGTDGSERIYIPAGLLLNGVDHLQISDQIFTDSKAPWETLCGPGTKHPGAYEA